MSAPSFPVPTSGMAGPEPDGASITPALPPESHGSAFSDTMHWLREGLRAAFLLAPRARPRGPLPYQVLLIGLLYVAADIGLSRLEIEGPARFDAQIWLSQWWLTALMVGLAWWAFPARPGPGHEPAPGALQLGGVPAFFVLALIASLPGKIFYAAITLNHPTVEKVSALAGVAASWVYWGIFIAFLVWAVLVDVMLVLRFAGRTVRAAGFVLAVLLGYALIIWQFDARAWQEDYSQQAQAEQNKPRLRLSQETMEDQQALLQTRLAALAPERAGVTDVYGLVFAPYADEDVFMRESAMVSGVLAERFDAAGRVVHLLNHVSTTDTHPWATPLNLQRAIEALALRMDRENDVLVVYATSHGARDFKLAASHWPLQVEPLSPALLREALDTAGIRHRVIAVSACYSGGWVDALASEHALVMTAADASNTSYGCGRLSELTFFGRAVFNEQLRTTYSFEKAFAQAVPLIKQREIDAKKPDGFSNPQISVGAAVRPKLAELERRLAELQLPVVASEPVRAVQPATPAISRP